MTSFIYKGLQFFRYLKQKNFNPILKKIKFKLKLNINKKLNKRLN